MRIVVCHSQVPFEHGGADVHVNELCRQLRLRGHQADVVQLPQQWEPRSEIIKNYMLWRMLSLTHTYQQQPIDRVICLKYPSYAVQHPHKVTWLNHQLRQAYELYGTPYSFMGNTPEDHGIREAVRRMDTLTIAESQRVFAVSTNVATRLERYNGIHAAVLYPPTALEDRLHCDAYGDYVLSVGRLTRIKRVDLLIEALAHVKTPVRCLIAGTGEDGRRLRRLALLKGVATRCQFLGYVDDESLLSLYANCLAVYYAPLDEDYGLVPVEAMKSSKAVLTAHDSGGVTEFVADGETGYRFAPEHPQELAAKLDALYEDRHSAEKLGRCAFERTGAITWDTAIARLLEAAP